MRKEEIEKGFQVALEFELENKGRTVTVEEVIDYLDSKEAPCKAKMAALAWIIAKHFRGEGK